MTKFTRTTALALITSLTLVLAGSAAAEQPKLRLVAPTPGYDLPRFGFHSYNIANYGERVTYVRWGGLASQLGLEPGDTILRLNGYPLSYHGAWSDALYQAISGNGWVRLTIRDVRTGHIAHRQTFVGSPGYGPITPKSHSVGYPGPPTSHYGIGQPVGPITPKSNGGPGMNKNHHLGPQPKVMPIVKLFDKD